MNASLSHIFSNDFELEKAIAVLCTKVPIASGASGLAKELSKLLPGLSFRDVLTRGGWYRLGGVVDKDGQHIADDLVQWAEAEFEQHGDDIHAFVEDYADKGFRATRFLGKTHYLVAPSGTGAEDFLQIEIEELQEVVSHDLFVGEEPTHLEDLFEPPSVSKAKNGGGDILIPTGAAFYTLRRVVDVADFLKRLAAQKPEPQIIHRFFEAWEVSSAGATTQFSNHWVLAVREYLDRFRQTILQATPVAAMNGIPPKFEIGYGVSGLSLYQVIQQFDRQVGYPMAWFFHMLTTKCVPHAVARAVIDDVQSGFSYLPERDVKIVKDWLHRPFGF